MTQLPALELRPLFPFKDWPYAAVPDVAAGAYTIWNDAQLLYAGMAGRGMTADRLAKHREAGKKRIGLWPRLDAHAAGEREADAFCIAICDRMVLPVLPRKEIAKVADGSLCLDRLVRIYVRARLGFRFVETPDGKTASQLERDVRRGSLSVGKPLLNPLDD